MTSVWRVRLRFWLVYAGLGAAAATGQAPLGWWIMSIAALAVIFVILPKSATGRDWALRLWVAGIGYFAAALFWIIEPFLIEPLVHGWMAPFALILMAGGMALFWAAAGWLSRGTIWGLVVGLVLTEALRGWLFGGFPWAMLGHGLINTGLLPLASVTGALGLSLTVLIAAMLPALAQTWPMRAAGALASIGLLAIGWVWGGAQSPAPLDRPHIVRLVQPNAPQAEKWRGLEFFYRLLDQTAAPAEQSPALVLWPETAVPFLLEYSGDSLPAMQQASDAHTPAPMIGFGVQRLEDGRYFNSFAILHDSEITHIYDKHHLVPFGEYIPFSEWLIGTRLGGLAGRALLGYSAGAGPALLDLGALGQALPLICYEAIFPRHIRKVNRPDVVLQITNDAWFGDISGPYQHLAQAQLRAAEQGLPVLRVANTGVSAIIDARGQITAHLRLGETGFVDAPVPTALPPTVYARMGDWPMLALLLSLIAMLWLRRRTP